MTRSVRGVPVVRISTLETVSSVRTSQLQTLFFSIKRAWASEDESANSHATPAVGDIDSDGVPEVVVSNRQAKKVTVLNGVTGATIRTINLSFEPENGIVLAELDQIGDAGYGCAEIIVVENLGNDIAVYDCEGNLRIAFQSTLNDIGLPSVADFNGDGIVELYYRNEVVNPLTGVKLVAGSGTWIRDWVSGPIAVDIISSNPGLELITGNEIWAVNFTPNSTGGSLTKLKDMDDALLASGFASNKKYHPKYYSSWDDQWSAVSVADFNNDGSMDVLTSGALGTNYSGTTTVFFWDVKNNFVATYADASNNFVRGTGRINIADVDGDGILNANYVSDQKLYSLQLDTIAGVTQLLPKWTKGIDEGSSGFTGCTLFDFDGDGASETVYRSETNLYIIDGTNGSTRKSIPCISRTQEEYPIVADIDGDGASEICVTCYTSDATSFNPYSNTRYAHVRIYEADGGEVWQPSRSVWNQHGYYNVNVNDDLTIPKNQQSHIVAFSNGVCTPGDNKVLNNFLTQSPYVEADGCPSYVSPDIAFGSPPNFTYTRPTCPSTLIRYRL